MSGIKWIEKRGCAVCQSFLCLRQVSLIKSSSVHLGAETAGSC